MDALLLSRIQFALTIGFHFIFVPISIGLALMIVFSEHRYYKSGIPADKAASSFWIKLFTTTFAVGVATGLTMEFAFGTNWADYSRFVGSIFGAPLAAEGLFAFFLESTFLGVLLFGRDKVSRGFYYASTWLVWFGALLSAVWILIANSWMQTPQGYKIEGGRAVLTDFWAAALNPSFPPRYFHTVAACVITGSFVVAGICAWYLLKRRHMHFARQALVWSASVGLIVSLAMPFLGHWGALVAAEHQPVKMAAFENVTETRDGAPLWLFGWLTKNADGTYDTTGISIPRGLSLILHLNSDAKVTGLNSVPPQDRPPAQLVFQSYHAMIALSGVFVVLMALTLLLHVLRRLERARWLLWLLVVCVPLPIIASNLGWMAAEVGRQPWVVQGLLRTSDGVSPVVSASEVWTTLGLFGVIYLVLFIAWLRIFIGIIRKGPEDVVEMLAAERATQPAPAGAER
jgi:cytochrome d ubiquinol oxidase subunit I